MQEQTIKAGDVVQLKSGGPNMTVEWIDYSTNETYCVWFDKTANKGNKFAITSLKLVE